MKLSLLALVLCIGLLTWNAWLQIQITRISHSASLPSELKLTKLEIVNAQGNTVISASSDGTIDAASVVVGSHKGKAALLNENQLEFDVVKGEGADEKGTRVVAIGNDNGSGKLHLYDSDQSGSQFFANPTGCAITNSKENTAFDLYANKLTFCTTSQTDPNQITDVVVVENNKGKGKVHLYDSDQSGTSFDISPLSCMSTDSKNNISFELDAIGLELDSISNSDPNKSTHVAILENNQGSGRLHLLDSNQTGTSFNAYPTGFMSEDSKEKTAVRLDGDSLNFSTIKGEGVDRTFSSVVLIQNKKGTGTLDLWDSSNPSVSLVAKPDTIWSWDSANEHVNWELPTSDDKDAFIDVNSKNFSAVRSDEGTFLISCEGVEPYLEGFKVHLQIGNPTAMLVSTPKITLEWGAQAPKPDVNAKDSDLAYKDWRKSLQQTSVTLNSNLKPGFWNDVEVIVSPAKANELAHLKVSIQTPSVSLTHPPDQH